MHRESEKVRAIRAMKFVKVALTKEGYLTDISIAMLLCELERRGIPLSDRAPTLPEYD